MVECPPCTREVRGSNPLQSTYNHSLSNLGTKDGFKYDAARPSLMVEVTAYHANAIGVFIPLIVGLIPGLAYWLAITARRSGK